MAERKKASYERYPKGSFSQWTAWEQRIALYLIVRPYFTSKYKPLVQFQSPPPPRGTKFMVVSNHISYGDPPLIVSALDRPISFMAKQELFSNPLMVFALRFLKAFAVNRDRPSADTLKTALEVLQSDSDWCLGVFPEGTRSKEGTFLPFKPGYVRLAMKTKVPILPIGIYRNAQNRYCMHVGTLMTPTALPHLFENAEALNEAIYEQLCGLTGQKPIPPLGDIHPESSPKQD